MARKDKDDHAQQKSTGVLICTACFNDKKKKQSCPICKGRGYVPKP